MYKLRKNPPPPVLPFFPFFPHPFPLLTVLEAGAVLYAASFLLG